MKLLELGLLYALIGVGCGVAVMVCRPRGERHLVDAVLMTGLWPVYGPFVLASARGIDEAQTGSEVAFLVALRRAGGTPLAVLLPDQATVRALARRLRVAQSKVDEIDGLLKRPEFDERDALARCAELKERSASECAQSSAGMRVQNIRRLRGLRDRFSRELDEVGELLVQLRTQADVVRLAGAPDAETRDLVQEIISRVEGLDRMMDDEPCMALDRGPAPWNQPV
ncbi:MAG: hypothetical protein HY898_24370 [Deltaproteobacteria bacterium]|nr:hypothetical protein [Deltaproteobacteria bacterium]